MIKAVLLDLDNTLLVNPNESFVKAYLALADDYLGKLWDRQDVSRLFWGFVSGLRDEQRDIRQTNSQWIVNTLASQIGLPLDVIQHNLASFYTDVYPQLVACVRLLPSAQKLLKTIRQQGLKVVIATNPLYATDGILQRLSWAGLSAELSEYDWVTTADNMHFIKPSLAYYAEILARVGVEPDEALMVGDSVENDIIPARTLGLMTYYVGTDSLAVTVDGQGTLEHFEQLLQNGWLERLARRSLNPEAIEPQLRANVAMLFGMLSDVKPAYWNQHPDPDEWSILQILCHLLESETTVQLPRLQRVLAEDNPFLPNPKTPPGIEMPLCNEDGYAVAEQFREKRFQTIAWLATLRPEDWLRPARHSIFGLTTLLELAHFTAQHDRLHLTQLCQTLGKCE